MHRRRRRRLLTSLLFVAVGLLALSACLSSVPEYKYGNAGDLSETKLPGEAGITPLSCDGGLGLEGGKSDGGCVVSWSANIFPKMTSNGPAEWGCATTDCHAPGSNQPIINPSDAGAALASLEKYALISQPSVPYISTSGDPTKSSIECNVGGGCTPDMPPPPRQISDPDRCLLHAWLLCGAPNN